MGSVIDGELKTRELWGDALKANRTRFGTKHGKDLADCPQGLVIIPKLVCDPAAEQ